jgi:hypothetical protein
MALLNSITKKNSTDILQKTKQGKNFPDAQMQVIKFSSIVTHQPVNVRKVFP